MLCSQRLIIHMEGFSDALSETFGHTVLYLFYRGDNIQFLSLLYTQLHLPILAGNRKLNSAWIFMNILVQRSQKQVQSNYGCIQWVFSIM